MHLASQEERGSGEQNSCDVKRSRDSETAGGHSSEQRTDRHRPPGEEPVGKAHTAHEAIRGLLLPQRSAHNVEGHDGGAVDRAEQRNRDGVREPPHRLEARRRRR